MKNFINLMLLLILTLMAAFRQSNEKGDYKGFYRQQYEKFITRYEHLMKSDTTDKDKLLSEVHDLRICLKNLDFWWRYCDPVNYKLINGPLPFEWETEVFEKFEKPYKRVGKGLTLAENALNDGQVGECIEMLIPIKEAVSHFEPDSMEIFLNSPDNFAFCNRLFLLNMAAIYTTGFECPDSSRILPELKEMITSSGILYSEFNNSFQDNSIESDYLTLYAEMSRFVAKTSYYSNFDHFKFISEYVNPLYKLNCQWILKNDYRSKSMVDYSLNKQAVSIFDKNLYFGQNSKGIFLRVKDEWQLKKIDEFGKLLFHDPILSGNNQRSCASCHKPEEYYSDNSYSSALRFDQNGRLSRNTPTTINAEYNHLIMLDGRFISLQEQALAVISNPEEMASGKNEVMRKLLSCKTYKAILKDLCRLTPQKPEPDIEHVISALTYHYSKFSQFRSRFDLAMEARSNLTGSELRGFNLFMSKAQCATCHFLPHFNGVKPPYVSSEFEVIGVPADTAFKQLSGDSGRYKVNPAKETLFAFRTGTLRNISRTAPYMHNGVFGTLEEVIRFYNDGGAAGRGIPLENQTLSSDKLGLSEDEIKDLLAFLKCLDENVLLESPPEKLPVSKFKELNNRKVGGSY